MSASRLLHSAKRMGGGEIRIEIKRQASTIATRHAAIGDEPDEQRQE